MGNICRARIFPSDLNPLLSTLPRSQPWQMAKKPRKFTGTLPPEMFAESGLTGFFYGAADESYWSFPAELFTADAADKTDVCLEEESLMSSFFEIASVNVQKENKEHETFDAIVDKIEHCKEETVELKRQFAPPASKRNIAKPLPQNKSVFTVDHFLLLFEELRIKPVYDKFEQEGKFKLRKLLVKPISMNQPIRILLPAFPCKSPNRKEKVIADYPDRGEELALARMHSFCKAVTSFYPPGCKMTILCDGRVFADLIGVEDRVVTEYVEKIKQMVKDMNCSTIDFASLDEHMGCHPDPQLVNSDNGENSGNNKDNRNHNNSTIDNNNNTCKTYDEARQLLVEQYACSAEDLDKRIREHPDTTNVYRGFIKFLEQDREWENIKSRNQIKKSCSLIARQMMLRNEAFSRLSEKHYGDYLRFSIHAHSNAGPKYGVRLLREMDQPATPWHNVVLRTKEGREVLMKKLDAEKIGKIVEKNGVPWFYEEL